MYGFQAEMTNYRLPYQLRRPRRSKLIVRLLDIHVIARSKTTKQSRYP